MNNGLVSVEEALATLLGQARAVAEIEDVPTLGATGRVLARAQRSTMDVPPMDNSAMMATQSEFLIWKRTIFSRSSSGSWLEAWERRLHEGPPRAFSPVRPFRRV